MTTQRLILIFTLLTLITSGQTTISGVVTYANGDSVAFASVTVMEKDSVICSTQTDFEGKFLIKKAFNYKNKILVARSFIDIKDSVYPLRKSIPLTSDQTININMVLQLKNNERYAIESYHNCRIDYIIKGMYYVDLHSKNDSLSIVKGDHILKTNYSPYDYQIIQSDKKYQADNGNIFTGKEIIKQRKLPLNLWEKSNFTPLDK